MKRNSSYFFMHWAILLLVFNTLTYSSVWAQAFGVQNTTTHFLPTEKAFILHSPEYEDDQIILRWTIASGYYLYRDHIMLTVSTHQNEQNSTSLPLAFPDAKIIQDPYLGEQAVYENDLTLSIPLTAQIHFEADTLTVHYQGCSIKGLCYPPVEKSFHLQQKIVQTAFAEPIMHLTQSDYFDNASLLKTLLTFYGLGILLSFTPCVLPMLPILSAIIIGQKKISTRKSFFLSLIYTLSMALILALLGVIAVAFGKNLQLFFQHPIMIVLFATLFFYLGLTQLGIGKLALPGRWQQVCYQWQSRFPAGSYINAFIMGALAILIASPCVSAPLVGALSYIAQTNDYLYGALALFSLGLGMGTLLIGVGTLGGRYLPKTGAWMHIINKIFASLLFALSIWILSRILNPAFSMGLWAIWCLLNAYWLGTFANLKEMMGRTMGVLFIIAACIIGLFAIQGETNPSHRLGILWQPIHAASPKALVFTEVNSLDDLKQKLDPTSTRPALLKVHASWCVSCKENEKVIFATPEVQHALQHWQLLLLDLSEMTAAKQQIIQHFSIFGPPTILFFKANNQEKAQERLIGKANRAQFLAKLEKLSDSEPHTANLEGNFN